MPAPSSWYSSSLLFLGDALQEPEILANLFTGIIFSVGKDNALDLGSLLQIEACNKLSP